MGLTLPLLEFEYCLAPATTVFLFQESLVNSEHVFVLFYTPTIAGCFNWYSCCLADIWQVPVSNIDIGTPTVITDAVHDFLSSVFVPALIKSRIYLRTILLCHAIKWVPVSH